MSARVLRAAALASLVLSLGACDLIVKAAYGDRHVDHTIDCATGECVCVDGLGDCDGDPDNGCEADLSAAPNCGACGNKCTNGTCAGGSCECSAKFDDCDGDPLNGCETHLDDDRNNCGVCGKACTQGPCVQGSCTATSFGQYPGAQSLAIQPSFALVGGCSNPPILAYDLQSGESFKAVNAEGCAHAVAVAGGRTLWLSDTDVLTALMGPPFGGKPTSLFNGTPGRRLAASSTYVYWEEQPQTMPALMRVAAMDGPVSATIISADNVRALAVDETNAYWVGLQGLHAVRHDDTTLTIVDIDPAAHSNAIAADSANLYAAVGTSLFVYPLPPTAGSPSTTIPLSVSAQAIAVDSGRVYWLGTDGSVMRMSLDGTDTEALATGETFVQGSPIVLDALDVYWLGSGGIRRIGR